MRLAERAGRRGESKHVATDMWCSQYGVHVLVTCPLFVEVNFLRPNRARCFRSGFPPRDDGKVDDYGKDGINRHET
jgi:hypothetical protein